MSEQTKGIVAWIVIGLVAGLIANFILFGGGGLVGSLIAGLIGSVVGGFLARQLNVKLNLGNPFVEQLVISVVGAPPNDATPQANLDVCFSPAGRTFVRYAQNGTWNTLTGVPVVSVHRQDDAGVRIGLLRNILLLPNGAVRLAVAQ